MQSQETNIRISLRQMANINKSAHMGQFPHSTPHENLSEKPMAENKFELTHCQLLTETTDKKY